MEDATKHLPINGGTLFTDLRQILSLRTKKTRAFAYAFILIFIGFTVFLAFNPSPNPSSPWFSNIFTSGLPTTTIANSNSSSSSSSGSLRSQFSSIYSYLFPSNSSQPLNSTASTNKPVNNSPPRSPNTTAIVAPDPNPASSANKTANFSFSPPIGTPSPNSSAPVTGSPPAVRTDQGSSVVKNNSSSPPVRTEGSSVVKNNSSPPPVRTEGSSVVKSNSSTPAPVKSTKQSEGVSVKQNDVGNLVKSLVGCNLFDGDWVRDESYPLYKPGSCPLIDYQFNCILNGRPDRGFQKLKWKPYGCSLPRLDGSHMLELLRGKRLVFVGDSLNRNMWESLICILRNSVKDQTKVYEASGRHHFRTEPSYSFVFKDFNCTVEFFVSPFLVREWEVKEKNGKKKETLRLDLIGSSADQYKSADIIVYNTGHWWTHDKTAKGKDYYQEGSNVYSELNVLEAFRKAMTTWGRWVDANINPMRTLVFFRGYSAAHFSGGQWNSGGQCDHEVEPIKNKSYLAPYPAKMMVMEKILRNMKTKVSYLNITRLTDYRKDGHPSIYRKRQKPQNTTEEEEKIIPLHVQDCSHWCLPGVPDAWNEILYAELLVKYYQKP